MERKLLQPEQLIVPGEYKLGNELVLKIYFRLFNSGHGEDLPPVIVVHNETVSDFYAKDSSELRKKDPNYLYFKRCYEAFNQALANKIGAGAEYFLLDGNHKSVAATLSHSPIFSLELESDVDFHQGKRLVESGDLFNWTIPGDSLEEAVNRLRDRLFECGCLDASNFYPKTLKTVKQRVDELTSNADLPSHMVEIYHRTK